MISFKRAVLPVPGGPTNITALDDAMATRTIRRTRSSISSSASAATIGTRTTRGCILMWAKIIGQLVRGPFRFTGEQRC